MNHHRRSVLRLWPLWCIVGAALLAVYATRPTPHFEVDIVRAVQAVDPAPARWVADAMTALGVGPWFLLITVVASIALLAWRRQPSLALLLVAAYALRPVTPIIKDIVDRPRPTPDVVDVSHALTNAAYPSGHVVSATLLFGSLIYCVEVSVPDVRARRAVQAALLALIVLMGYARVEVGAHWPTDVIGGWLLGAGLVGGLAWMHGRWRARRSLVTPARDAAAPQPGAR